MLRLFREVGAASPQLEADARGENRQPHHGNPVASHLPPRHDQRRPVAQGVAPGHVPVGVVVQWREREPTEVARTSSTYEGRAPLGVVSP